MVTVAMSRLSVTLCDEEEEEDTGISLVLGRTTTGRLILKTCLLRCDILEAIFLRFLMLL